MNKNNTYISCYRYNNYNKIIMATILLLLTVMFLITTIYSLNANAGNGPNANNKNSTSKKIIFTIDIKALDGKSAIKKSNKKDSLKKTEIKVDTDDDEDDDNDDNNDNEDREKLNDDDTDNSSVNNDDNDDNDDSEDSDDNDDSKDSDNKKIDDEDESKSVSKSVCSKGCRDERSSSMKNKLREIKRKSMGNSTELSSDLEDKITPQAVIEDLKKLLTKIDDKKDIEAEDREELLTLLDNLKKYVLAPDIQKIQKFANQARKLNEQDKKELNLIIDTHLSKIWPNKTLSILWEKAIKSLGDKFLGAKLREPTLLAEYYTKLAKGLLIASDGPAASWKKKVSNIRIKLDGYKVAGVVFVNENQNWPSIKKFIYGDPDSSNRTRQGGAIGLYKKWANDEIAKQERLEREEERLKERRDALKKKKERIADGELFSPKLIRQAKLHHVRYLEYYNTMVKKCSYPLYTNYGCQKAMEDFNKTGKEYHLRRMFNLIEMSKKDAEEEAIAKVRKAREDYLSEYSSDNGKKMDYSIFANDEEYGEYAERFNRARDNRSYDNAYLHDSDNLRFGIGGRDGYYNPYSSSRNPGGLNYGGANMGGGNLGYGYGLRMY
ncbi:MAG: hypothetical protein HQK49_20845 [Oligoflexia bacterium]|nr:hypothetical protein [Oligoflexia bacterium]